MIPRKPFYFLRHGETDHNVKPALTNDDFDMPLNACGVKQAQGVRTIIQDLPAQVIYHSPLLRAKQTMEVIALSLTHQRVEVEELKECLPHVWLSMCRMSRRGCSPCDASQRFFNKVIRAMKGILKDERIPLLVAHGGVHFALCHLLEVKDHSKAIDNCSLVYFSPTGQSSWSVNQVFPSLPTC